MCVRPRVVVLGGALLLAGVRLADAQTVLTLADVLARARERAPQIVSARLALEEARGRLPGASLRLQSNPDLDVQVGDRRPGRGSGTGGASGGRATDYSFGLSQRLEPSSRRSARLAGADAAIAQGTADIDETTRVVLRDAASAWIRALGAGERVRLLSAAVDLAAGIHGTAERRFKAGDIAVLDVNIARASLARARAEREAAEAVRSETLGDLGQLLGLDAALIVQGDLATAEPARDAIRATDPPAGAKVAPAVPPAASPGSPATTSSVVPAAASTAPPVAAPTAPPAADPSADLAAALQSASRRPDLLALDAAIREAEADVQLGRTFSRPDYGFNVKYGQDDGDRVVVGGLTVTLPLFAKGQDLLAPGAARAARLRAERDAAGTRVRIEVRAAFEAYARRLAAVRTLQTEALPGLDENDALAARSFEVGQLGLPDLLLIRREILDTRLDYLDAQAEAALARIDLDARAGVLR